MRYFEFVLQTNAEMIKDRTTINLREYSYESPIGALNNFLYTHLKNDIIFFAYREEENATFSVFACDERKSSFSDAYEHVREMLKEYFGAGRIKSEPQEITMYQTLDCLLEAKRREFIGFSHRFIESSHLWIYYTNNDPTEFRFDFQESIIPEKECGDLSIYDRSFLKELENIRSHENNSDFRGNMVHYVLSAKSADAAIDMTQRLLQSLYKAHRLSSRRIEIISEIDPEVFHKQNYLEEIIENNPGGAIVLDLTEKFGYDPVDYTMTVKYIEKLIKRYRNHCLFLFTYRTDYPGFSYQLLPELSKYVIPVMLKEGKGDRNAAVSYLEELIENSEYAGYAEQADEFLKLTPGNAFSQTDVLAAFEKFGAWCINKNVLHAYSYDLSQDFMLDREAEERSPYEKLGSLIGLSVVKKQIEGILAVDIIEKERKRRIGRDYQSLSMHMVFAGNPGSAKTTVAKLFAGIAKEKGVLKSGAFVERGGMDLDGICCVSAIREAFLAAKGGVLFIDEAYSMKSDTAVTVLIQEMENQRDNVIVILAGYNERMKNFMELNEGLKSRLPHWIDFPDYTAKELTEIFRLMLKERGFKATDEAVEEANRIFIKARCEKDFGNGRYVRNLLDRAVQNQAVRLLSGGREAGDIKKGALFSLTKDDIGLPEQLDAAKIRQYGFAC